MCEPIVEYAKDLRDQQERVKQKIYELESSHPKLYRQLSPLLYELNVWLITMKRHTENLYVKDAQLVRKFYEGFRNY